MYGISKLDIWERIEGIFGEDFQEKSYIYMSDDKRDFFSIDSKKFSRPKYMESLPFRSVYVSPFDMNILYFSPQSRRDYIDDILVRWYTQFASVKKNYELIMKQRNALLKKIREDGIASDQLNFWDKKFAEIAFQYGLYRKKYMEYVSWKIVDFPDFFWKYQVKIHYEWAWIFAEDPEWHIIEYLRVNRERDILSWHTHIGPHRDDFSLQMKKTHNEWQSVQFFLSRWEMKMLLLWLKIIEADFMQKQTEKAIILLVDDIFAELDEKNILLFLNIIIQHQIILTSQKPLPDAINSQKFTCINLTNS